MTDNEDPHLIAMREAMQAAEEAAERRRLAKVAAAHGERGRPDELPEAPSPAKEAHNVAFELGEAVDLGGLIAELEAILPDVSNEERHGDLVLLRSDAQPDPWYRQASEEALPAALRAIKGPIDVKTLLQALLIEVGDVKRTNAILLEHMTRLEEKIDRTNRHLRERHF